eukprot:287564_1
MSKTSTVSVLKNQLLYLARYNKWTYNVINEYSVKHFGYNEDHYTRITSAPFFTTKSTLYHILLSEQIWWQRLTNIPVEKQRLTIQNTEFGLHDLMPLFAGSPELQGKNDVFFDGKLEQPLPMNEMYDMLNTEAQKFIDYVEENDDSKFGEMLSYPSAGGKMVTQPIHFLITNHVNHNTHHRGQISSSFNELLRNRDPIPENVHLDMHVWERGWYFAEKE